MTAMDYLPSDLEHMNTNFLDMIENEANSQLLDIDNLNTDKLNDILNGDMLHETQIEYETDDVNSNWLHSLHWTDASKVPQSLIDASNEVENNNPNLLVNPQSVLPMHSSHHVQNNNTTQHMNQLNARNGIAVKINGQDAVLTPTQHPQIQYVTVQNVTTLSSAHIGYTVQPITICPQQVQHVGTVTSPSLTSPVLVEHLQTQTSHIKTNNNKVRQQQQQSQEKVYPKPVYSYSCLIAMALKNSRTGNLPVSEIYNFMIDNFPYFKTAPDGWKNSVRHNLSLNKCFAKVDNGKTAGSHTRKGCLWGLNPAKIEKMAEEIVKWRKKDPESVKLSMSKPENLELIEQGKAGPPREDSVSPIKQEPMTPTKSQIQSVQSVGTQQQGLRVCKQEPVPLTEMDANTEVTPFDHAMTEQILSAHTVLATWEDGINVVGNNNQPVTTCSPLVSPTYNGKPQYHGNVTYTCASPQGTRSPAPNMTPTKMYQQTPTKIYPQTPSKLVLA